MSEEHFSNWSFCENGELGSDDCYAAFAPDGCRLTIQYEIRNPWEWASGRAQHARLRKWLAERKIRVTFRAKMRWRKVVAKAEEVTK